VFVKGQVPNPNGRPVGSRHKTTLAIEALLEGEAEGLTRKAIEMALSGDMIALRLCLDRIAPEHGGSHAPAPVTSARRAPKIRVWLSSRRTPPLVFDRTHSN
jgi:hypothetical protein